MSVVKWTFTDPVDSSTYQFEINPNEMGTPFPSNETTKAGLALDGLFRTTRRLPPPVEWTFNGILRSQAQYDAFVTWVNKPNRIILTDHFGRSITVRLTQFEPKSRQTTAQTYWRYTYTMHTLVYEVA